MMPIHLSMEAFGAFGDPVDIDFAALAPRGLFLVSGATGTGKTTIFDAMCWALYGRMPLKDEHEVRSHHVDESTRCEVRFTFDVGGDRYCVTRNPDQQRPATRGRARSVREAASATLVRLVETDGRTGSEPIADKVSDVARACEQLIGLDADQFQRVILLPQGEFNRFLLARSADREKVLERLFGGEIYDRIVDELKAARDATSTAVGDAETAMAGLQDTAHRHLDAADAALDAHRGQTLADGSTPLDEFDRSDDPQIDVDGVARLASERRLDPDDSPDDGADAPPALRDLDEALARVATTLEHRRAELAEANRRRDRAQSAHDAAVNGAKRFDEAVALRATLEALDDHTAVIEKRRLAAVASERARPIVKAADDLSATESAYCAAKDQVDQRRSTIESAFAGLGVANADTTPVALQGRLAECRAAHAADELRLSSVQAADEAVIKARTTQRDVEAKLREATEERAVLEKTSAQIDEELRVGRADPVDLDAVRGAITTAEQRIEDRGLLESRTTELVPLSDDRATAARVHQELLRAFTETQAPRLANALEDERPCPVCGSTDHPAPATTDGTRLVEWDEVTAAGDRATDADEAVRSVELEITELRGRLGEASSLTVGQLGIRADDLRAELDRASQAVANLAKLESEKSRLATSLASLIEDVARLGEAHEHATRALDETERTLRKAVEAASDLDPATLADRAASIEQLDAALDGYDALVERATRCATLLEDRRGDLTARLSDSDFADDHAAREVVLAPVDEAAALAAAQRHRSERDQAEGALTALTDGGLPDERPDPASTGELLATANDARQRLESLVTTLGFSVSGAAEALDECHDLDAATHELQDRAEIATRAHQVCAKGGPALPVSLKRWVLAHELDRIAEAANVHLAGMTNGRYRLRRRIDRVDGRRSFGLDLEVDDATTGRPRSTASLSGGEQFQASLSLALGLADVISHGGTAGGQNFEALFVDEGFGSLSADALDDAVETLLRLHGTGRLVGAITHVEAMKQVLHVGIEVTGRDDGRGSRVTVNT